MILVSLGECCHGKAAFSPGFMRPRCRITADSAGELVEGQLVCTRREAQNSLVVGLGVAAELSSQESAEINRQTAVRASCSLGFNRQQWKMRQRDLLLNQYPGQHSRYRSCRLTCSRHVRAPSH